MKKEIYHFFNIFSKFKQLFFFNETSTLFIFSILIASIQDIIQSFIILSDSNLAFENRVLAGFRIIYCIAALLNSFLSRMFLEPTLTNFIYLGFISGYLVAGGAFSIAISYFICLNPQVFLEFIMAFKTKKLD